MVRHVTVYGHEWRRDPAAVRARAATLGYPLFVKPANLGSSVGISKVREAGTLTPAIETALAFDRKLVIEAGVANAREIECAVLGNDDPVASIPGEIIVTHPDGFYSYDAKYVDASGSSWQIPADLSPALTSRVQAMSVEAFKALELSGLARVDFFVDRESGELFLNEVNTLPGFTAISMYPKMWEASGLPMPALIDKLIALAIERHEEKQRLRTSVT
jgi:D-alanine-D-alanine ligase